MMSICGRWCITSWKPSSSVKILKRIVSSEKEEGKLARVAITNEKVEVDECEIKLKIDGGRVWIKYEQLWGSRSIFMHVRRIFSFYCTRDCSVPFIYLQTRRCSEDPAFPCEYLLCHTLLPGLICAYSYWTAQLLRLVVVELRFQVHLSQPR